MPLKESSPPTGRWQPMPVVGAAGVCTFAWLMLFAARGRHADVRGTWGRVDRIAHAVGGMTFAMPVSVLSAPPPQTPAPVAPSHVGAKPTSPWIAAAVSIGLLHQVVVARVGGRYGP